jgi:hypothetical protein
MQGCASASASASASAADWLVEHIGSAAARQRRAGRAVAASNLRDAL